MNSKWVTETRGHVWRKDEDGSVDVFGLDFGYHNGPVCIHCGYSFCEHCDDGPQEDCPRSVAIDALLAELSKEE